MSSTSQKGARPGSGLKQLARVNKTLAKRKRPKTKK